MYNRKTLQIEETKRNRRKQNKKTNKRQSKDTFHFETLNKIKTRIRAYRMIKLLANMQCARATGTGGSESKGGRPYHC